MQLIRQEEKQPAMLKGISAEHYAGIFNSGIRKRIKQKQILFHEGDTALSCYLLLKGGLKLTKSTRNGKEIIIRYIGPAELTAQVAVLKEKKYPATAEALKDTEVIAWDKKTLHQLMRQYPDIAINMLDTVLERLNDVQLRYAELSSEPAEQRIAHTLMRLMQHAGKNMKDGVCIDIPLGRQDIADYCGASIYTVSRILQAWEKDGWIKSGRKQVTVVASNAIVNIASTD